MKTIRYFGAVQNMGWVDRALRFVLGLALVVVALMELESSNNLAIYAPIIAIYPLMTALFGWDPLYALSHSKSCDTSKRNQCGTFPYEVEAALGKKVECDQGYDCSLGGDEHAHQASR